LKQQIALNGESVPQLARGARLQHDKTRGVWIVQAPERYFELDAVATDIVQRIDGIVSLALIVDELAALYNAPRERIYSDVSTMLQNLIDKGVLET
jgi:pyrroloquinoline quinone biosynthesis protein D